MVCYDRTNGIYHTFIIGGAMRPFIMTGAKKDELEQRIKDMKKRGCEQISDIFQSNKEAVTPTRFGKNKCRLTETHTKFFVKMRKVSDDATG